MRNSRYTVTVRSGPRVDKERFQSIEQALAHLEQRGRELQRTSTSDAVDVPAMRRFEPVQQVAARIELSGPKGLSAGIDVRGDGSTEGWTGRLRRRLLEQKRGEDVYEALKRAVSAT